MNAAQAIGQQRASGVYQVDAAKLIGIRMRLEGNKLFNGVTKFPVGAAAVAVEGFEPRVPAIRDGRRFRGLKRCPSRYSRYPHKPIQSIETGRNRWAAAIWFVPRKIAVTSRW